MPRVDMVKRSPGHEWHELATEEAVRILGSDPLEGLEPQVVAERRERFGPNTVPAQTGHGPLVRFLLQFHQPLIYILLAASLITLLLREYIESGVIMGVVLVNALIGFLQEGRAAAALEALSRTMITQTTVIRDGERHQVCSEELVPGDIVVVASGDKVPADIRLLASRNLQVDESALTGESVPVSKTEAALGPDTPLADRSNMVYSSSLVTYGQARGMVVQTGLSTEVGRISELVSGAEQLATPLTRQIARFSHVLLYVILALAAFTMVVGALRGQPWIDVFMAAVALAVGAIPEGLPAAVTITLAIGVGRMARRRAIIRKLPAVETLGSTTVICSDKTGTLTENQMTVQQARAGGEIYDVSGTGYAPVGQIVRRGEGPASPSTNGGPSLDNVALRETLLAGLLCNDSTLKKDEGRWILVGDPTEGALLAAAGKFGMGSEDHDGLPRIDSIPFESEHQYMATMHDPGSGEERAAYVKGALEPLLERCRWQLNARGEPEPLDTERAQADFEAMAVDGMRVLAFARGSLPRAARALEPPDVSDGLTFLGLQGMIDPPRAEVISAVRDCHTAGIRVKMVTGDHALTAATIAEMIGLDGHGGAPGNERPKAVSGRELAQMSDERLQQVADETAVFARVTPEQKLRLVRALQSTGHVVAMTGDGVNDAPALRQANIGVAMGITGTEVSKEAADMVLTDDNFASIEAAVEEGRGVFANLTKFIVWTLPTNLGEGLVILAAVLLGATLPILPLQILWINMTTAVLLGLMLAFEPKEGSIMQRPPRDTRRPILNRPLVGRIALVGGFLLLGSFGLFQLALERGAGVAEARTIAVNVFVMVEIFYLFNCRSLDDSPLRLGFFSNRYLLVGVAIMIVLQMTFTYSPVMNTLFNSAPIGLVEWGWILIVAAVAFVAVELEKLIRRRTGHRAW